VRPIGTLTVAGAVAAIVIVAALVAPACGGSPSGPSSNATPAPPVTLGAVAAVRGLVFYDEDGDGKVGAEEEVRLPEVTVTVGTRSAATDGEGRFEVREVSVGAPRAEVVLASLPPYFAFGPAPSVPVPPPDGFELALAVTLPIGTNRPNVYMAFGDSITQGDGSRGRRGYRDELQGLLAARFGRARVENEGVSGTDSLRGLDRLPDSLARQEPAFVLIHYGTNDWNGFGCRVVCGTAENLRRMVRVCREARSLPVVATLIPANPAFEDRLASARNAWILATNVEVRAMAAAEGTLLADLHAAFLREDPTLEPLFSDHVHPNDRGYEVMAAEFFRALSAARQR
jgi:lysophospholipase L1-like esterase